MCGIAGLINISSSFDAEAAAGRMAAQLRHRGPDGAAYHADDNAVLVHTRLSIIDLATGAQPLHNEDKTIWLVCNGEIFNYLELRAELQARGHRFYTQSDCEVILHLYEEHGLDCVDYLNGQFAFCLWDSRAKTAVLVRDRVGIAPLFYNESGSTLCFGSEVKAILAGLQERPSLDADGFFQQLHFWAPVAPRTLFSGIRELPPGEMLIVRDGKSNRRRYWDLDFPTHNDYAAVSDEQAAEEVGDLLLDATRLRLRADVPVAAYLSGGLDSSIITTLVRKHSSAPLKTYSLTFADENLDESQYQQEIVRQLATEHHSVRCSDEALADNFQDAIWHAETPLIRSAPVPMSLLSGLVQDDSTRVVLTGEGADEVFGGYDIFKEAKLRRFWATNPNSEWRPLLVRRLYPYLNLSRGSANDYLANFFGAGVEHADHPLFSHQPRMNTTARVGQFLSAGMQSAIQEDPQAAVVNSLPERFSQWSYFCKAQYLEMKTLMAGYLLSAQGDRMLMKNSVEGRFPFLDHRLIEYANRLHPRLKMRVLNEKYILKRAMADQLPKRVLQRYKQPYRAPMSAAFLGKHEPDYLRYLLSENKLKDYGYFDPKRVSLLLKKARAGRMMGYKDNMALVVVLSTQCWHQQFIENFGSRLAADPFSSQPLQRVA